MDEFQASLDGFERFIDSDVENRHGNNDGWRGSADSGFNWASNFRCANDTLPFPGVNGHTRFSFFPVPGGGCADAALFFVAPRFVPW